MPITPVHGSPSGRDLSTSDPGTNHTAATAQVQQGSHCPVQAPRAERLTRRAAPSELTALHAQLKGCC